MSACVMFAAGVLLPATVMAATVQVVPTITNAHGGNKIAKDITVCIEYGNTSDCAQGVPTFTVPDGSNYTVKFQPPTGYNYTTDFDCNGVAQGDIKCHVDYEDGTPIDKVSNVLPLIGTDTIPAPTPQPQVAQLVAPQISLPTPVAVTTVAATSTSTIPSQVATSTATSTMSEAEQIAALQQQILELYNFLIALLQQKLVVLAK